MKFPFCILLFLNTMAFAVERPGGFIGIPWGASPEEAKRILQKQPDITFPENAYDDKIELTGGTFAGQPVAKWVIEFPDRKFASAAVTLKTESSAGSVFKEFCKKFSEKYCSPTSEKKLTTGKAGQSAVYNPKLQGSSRNVTTWRFPITTKDRTVVVVSAELAGPRGQASADESQFVVTLKYVNETLTGAAENAKKPAGPAKPAAAPLKKDDL